MLLSPVDTPREPLLLPDVRRLERMPSLPAWAASLLGSLNEETQQDQHGRWRPVPTLPPGQLLQAGEREAIEQHVMALERLLGDTPDNSAEAEKEMLAAVTKIMLVLPTVTQNELSAQARGEAFLDALSDLPVWSVCSAIRRWHRRDCGTDERGRPYDYHWCPSPADLQRVALIEVWRIKGRAQELRRLLAAKPRREFGDEYRRDMLERYANLLRNIQTSLVGRNGSSEATGGVPV